MKYVYISGKPLNGLKNRRYSKVRMFSHNEYTIYYVYKSVLEI